MTGTKISGMFESQSAGTNAVANVNAAGKTGKKEDTQSVFANLISQSAMNVANSSAKSETQNQMLQTSNHSTKSQFTSQDVKNIQQAKNSSSSDIAQMKEKLSEKSEIYSEDVKDVIKNELGVTDEQIEDAMSNLGMTALDLTNPANLSQLVVELTGSTDSCALLMSDEFQNIMQEVGQLTESLMDELGITQDQLTALINDSNLQAQENPQFQKTLEEAADTLQNNADDLEANKQVDVTTSTGNSEVKSEETTQEQTMNVNAKDLQQGKNVVQVTETNDKENAGETKNLQTTVVSADNEEDATQNESSSNQGQHMADREGQLPENSNAGISGQNVQTIDYNAQLMQNQQIVEANQIDVQDIMKQLTEFTKVAFTQDGTSMEMQLNPENLGKIYLQISTTKEGNVTAQLAVQNETVKEALEAQIVTLKENLNQQGIKVDAIDVTVASHEFERNLEQNAQQEEQQSQQQEEAMSQGRRNLNRNSLDELTGLMTEEEILTAKIMQDNGNSMDVMA